MKTFLKSKFIVPLLILALLFAAGCAKKEAADTEKTYLPEVTALKIAPGLEHEFTVTGEVFAHQISRMTSEIRGKVESILVQPGDIVAGNTLLMNLSSSEVSSAFDTAGSTLRNAQVGLESTRLSAEKSIESAEIALDTAKTNLQNVIRQNRTLKTQAAETLKAAELSVGLGVEAAQTNLDNAVKNALPVIQTAVNASDRIWGISESYKFLNSESPYKGEIKSNLVGSRDQIAKNEAEKALREVLSQLASYEESFENALTLLILTENALQKTLPALINSRTGIGYSEADLNADITSITTNLTAIRGTISALESAKDALDSAEQETDGQSQTILNARAAYNATIEQMEANERNARKAVESAENALENAKRSAQLSEVSAQSSVTSAYGSYDQARISRDKLNIRAPFSGKVVDISVKKGEEVNPGTPLVTVEDDSELKLVAYLSPTDAEKVSAGDVVIINKNAEISVISSIAPSADPVTKKYKVEIRHSESALRPGELVKLTFKTGEKVFNSDRIFVPLPALHILPDEIFVWKLENGKTVKAAVTVGEIVGDYVEILNGLTIGEEIISEGGRLIEDEGTKVDILNRPTPKLPEAE